MQRNIGTTTENLTQAIGLFIDQKQNNFRSATFAVVTRVNTSTEGESIANTINALPLVEERINTKNDGKKYTQLPEIYNIPYVTSTGPQVGQYCVLIHLDRSIMGGKIDLVEIEGQQYPLIKTRKGSHRLSDCIAICGIQVDYLDTQVSEKTGTSVNNLSINTNSNLSISAKNSISLEEKCAELEARISKLENIINGGTNTNG